MTLARKAYLPDFQVIATVTTDNPPYGVRPNSYQIELERNHPILVPDQREVQASNQAVESQIATEANDVSVRQQTLLAVDTAYNTLRQTLAQLELQQAAAAAAGAGSLSRDDDQLRQQQRRFQRPAHRPGRAPETPNWRSRRHGATALQAYHALLAATGRSPVQAQWHHEEVLSRCCSHRLGRGSGCRCSGRTQVARRRAGPKP
ncbi:TolC family protein [Streptomyces sp. L7]